MMICDHFVLFTPFTFYYNYLQKASNKVSNLNNNNNFSSLKQNKITLNFLYENMHKNISTQRICFVILVAT